MARVFIDGFEAGDLKLWNTIGAGAGLVAAATGMDGSYCLHLASGGTTYYIQKTLPSNSEYYFAFRYRPSNDGSSRGMISFWSGGTLIGKLIRIGAAGLLVAYRGTTVIATGTTPLAIDTTYLIEVRFKPANSPDGVFHVKINGLLPLDIEFNGDSTDGAATIDAVRLGHGDSASTNVYAYFDNLVVDNAAWPGNTKIQAIKPTGAGASSHSAWAADTVIDLNEVRKPTVFNGFEYECTARADDFKTGAVEPVWGIVVGATTDDDTNITWTCRVGAWNPSTGDNYACVDEVPPSETDYVSLNHIGNVDTYAAGDLVGAIGSVKCVQVQALAKAEGEPTPTNLQLVLRSGGTDYVGSSHEVPNTNAAQLASIWVTDPATAAAWIESGINDMEIGVKAVA